MRTLLKINKFNRRYEIDLFGRIGLKHNIKMLNFIRKVYKEKEQSVQYLFYKKQRLKLNKYPETREEYLKKFKVRESSLLNEGFNKNNYKKKEYKQFVYRIDVSQQKRRRLKTSFSRDLFLINRKLRSFYGNIKKLQLRRYAKNYSYRFKVRLVKGLNLNRIIKFKNKKLMKKTLLINAFISILECRLDMFLYRSNFVKTVSHARHLIRYRRIFVNNKIVSYCNYQLRKYDFINMQKNEEINMRLYLRKKLKERLLFSYFPKYIFVSYKLMIGFIIKNPTFNNVQFPFKVQLKKWLGLTKMNV